METVHDRPRNVADVPVRRRDAALAGHRGDADAARAALADPDPGVRATALAALARAGGVTVSDLATAAADDDPGVRRRACEVAAGSGLAPDVVRSLLTDGEASVVEVAAWALGELADAEAVVTLAGIATGHEDALVREAAVAAMGAIGDPRGLPAILAATRDKPAVRRRAVLALAPFEGTDVDEALSRALEDRDWQVRDAAALLRDD